MPPPMEPGTAAMVIGGGGQAMTPSIKVMQPPELPPELAAQHSGAKYPRQA